MLAGIAAIIREDLQAGVAAGLELARTSSLGASGLSPRVAALVTGMATYASSFSSTDPVGFGAHQN